MRKIIRKIYGLILDQLSFLIIDKFLSKVFSLFGCYLFRKHYYLPIPEKEDLVYQKETEMVGVEINEKLAFELLDNVILRFKPEFNLFPIDKQAQPDKYYLLNSSFMAIDGNVYYSLIRYLKPKKVVEIGSGKSSLLAAEACVRNLAESYNTQLILIEPYPREILKKGFPGLSELKEKKVQEINVGYFETLEPGDILFIDSSHALKSGGDVWYEYCEILPRLKSGVYVHIHDVSLPKPYPKVYIDFHYFWNEQYLLQAFLTFNRKFEIIWPGNYLMCKYPEKMRSSFLPEYDLMIKKFPSSEPSSFWMRVK